MYNINVKRIFVITEIVHINAGVSSKKEKVKESQSQSRSVTPSLDIHLGCRVGGVTVLYTLSGWGVTFRPNNYSKYHLIPKIHF